ncbi:Hsp20/alpha crystallin family protein [Armatimonadetes bacterium]|nr:Hsp20/alpha crystallin family protein [bacterium]
MSGNIKTPIVPKAPFFKSINTEKSALRSILIAPAINIIETDELYLLSIAVPGLKKENFNIEIVNNIIAISAIKEMESLVSVNGLCEYDYTNWTRSFTLPEDAEVVFAKANYEEGELIIRIPKGGISETEKPLKVYVY